MNNADVIRELATRLGKSQKDVRQLLKTWSEIARSILDGGQAFTIPGLGTFRTKVRDPRKAYSPRHEQVVRYPSKRVVQFTSSAPLKRDVNAEASDHET